MTRPNRLYFPRLILAADTLFVLSLTMLAVVLIQLTPGLLCGSGYALGVLAVLALLPCAREWLSPSYLEVAGNGAEIKWNNWRLTGSVVSADLPAKQARRLVLKLSGAKLLIDPVGPLFLLSSWLVYPVIDHFVPSWWAPLYPVSRKQLASMLGIAPDGSLTLSFPVRTFGKRSLRRVIDNAAAGT
jgi:hypothetical protein